MSGWTGESLAGGRYTIGKPIGRGRWARVYGGYDHVLLRPVALKFLPAERWRAQASALDRVDHRHVLRLLDGGRDGDRTFLVLPLMAESLAGRLRRGTLDPGRAVGMVAALADALGHLHRAGTVHGGVDAAGVLLDDGGLPRWSGLPPVPDGAAGLGGAAELDGAAEPDDAAELDGVAEPDDAAEPGDAAGPGDVAAATPDADLDALARLAVHCVTGRAVQGATPPAVLEAVRSAAAQGQDVPDVRGRLTVALEAVAPHPAWLRRVPAPLRSAPAALRSASARPQTARPLTGRPLTGRPLTARPLTAGPRTVRVADALRGTGVPGLLSRPGSSVVLAAGLAASVVGALVVVHGGQVPGGPADRIGAWPAADPSASAVSASSESVASVGGALGRIGALAGAAVPGTAVTRAAAADAAEPAGQAEPAGPRVTVVSATDRPVPRSGPSPRGHDRRAGGDAGDAGGVVGDVPGRAGDDEQPGRTGQDRPDPVDGLRGLVGRVLSILG